MISWCCPPEKAIKPQSYPDRIGTSQREVLELLRQAKLLAQRYRQLTGKPLGITGEVAEYEAARTLGIALMPARHAGFDAIEVINGVERRLQIKGRCVRDPSKQGQRIGRIDTSKEWDAVLLVVLDENLDVCEIHEAERAAVIGAITAPGSKARNERGALALKQFTRIARLRWKRPHD